MGILSTKSNFKEGLNRLKSDQLLTSSTIVLVAGLGGGFLNYLFHLLVGRLLTPAEYGVLTSLLSLHYIFSVPGSVLGTTATKFASKYKAQGDFEAVTAALVWTSKVVAFLGATLFIGAFLFRAQLANFLKISNSLLPVLFFGYIALSFLGAAPQGFLRGLLRFKAFSFVSFFGTLLKLLLGVGIVLLGFGVWGVTWGLIISCLVTTATSLALLKKNLRFPFRQGIFVRLDLLRYALPTVIFLLTLNSFYNSDVVLVKHVFSPEEAGIYSSLVTLGRMIFFALSSVATVMFPMASESYENGGDPFKVLKGSLILVTLGALLGVIVYVLFPQLLVSTLFGARYSPAIPYLGIFALFMGLYSVVNLISRFFLSIGHFRVAVFLVIFAGLQIALLYLSHKTLLQVIYINIGTMLGILIAFGIYYFWLNRNLPYNT